MRHGPALLLLVCLAGCPSTSPVDAGSGGGSGGGSASGGGGGGASAVDCAGLAQDECDWLARCGQIVDAAGCRSLITQFCQVETSSLGSGRFSFDPMALAACRTALTQNDCVAPVACSTFLGQVDAGGTCANDTDCNSLGAGVQLVCGATASCPSTCVRAATPGLPCQGGFCTVGWCDATGFCQAPLAAGASCQDTPFNQPCAPNGACDAMTHACTAYPTVGQPCPAGRCDSASFCNAALLGATCEARHATGQACRDATWCQDGLGCRAGTCQPLLPTGAACTAGSDCQLGSCDPTLHQCVSLAVQQAGAVCADSARCVPPLTCQRSRGADGGLAAGVCGTGSVGDSCNGSTPCATGQRCASADGGVSAGPAIGTCVTIASSGPCRTANDCLSSEFCHAAVCTPRVAVNQSCDGGLTCVYGASCQGATCVAKSAPGTPCVTTADGGASCDPGLTCFQGTCRSASGWPGGPCSASGTCLVGACGADGLCGATRGIGQPCRADGECATDKCRGQTCAPACN